MTESTNLSVPAATVSRSAADALATAAIKAASDIGVEISVAIVDAGGAMKSFSRTDAAPFLTVDAAINKAWTAASFGYPTHAWNAYLADPKLAPLANTPKLMAVAGGHPILLNSLLGGIGVSGGSYSQDQEIAEVALKAVGFTVA